MNGRSGVPPDSSLERTLEEMVEDLAERIRRGETISLSEVAARHPQLASRIRELFPGLVLLEEARDDMSPGLRRIGPYRILREVGRGGMGVVYEANHESLARRVALKVLPSHHLPDDRFRERFRLEARAAASLEHSNIVRVYDFGEEAGVPYFAMQFIEGVGLETVLEELKWLRRFPGEGSALESTGRREAAPPSASTARSTALDLFRRELASSRMVPLGGESTPSPLPVPRDGPPDHAPSLVDYKPPPRDGVSSSIRSAQRYFRNVARLGIQAADGLHFAHTHGILHRDIKPSNLLLDASGNLYVSDFGLAKAVGSAELTKTGDVVGTLRYMAPERFGGWSDPRSDVYSLGLTLYELLTLRSAVEEREHAALIKEIAEKEPPRPRRLQASVPRDLETIVLKAMAKEPSRRYQTAEELSDDLERFLAGLPILARSSRTWEKAAKWARRRPAAAALVAVSSLAVLTLLFGSLWYGARVEKERSRSEANFRRACGVVNQMFTWLGEEGLAGVPQMEPVRRNLLGKAVSFYEALLKEKDLDPGVRLETGRAYSRMGEIHRVLREPVEARRAYLQAQALLQRLKAEFPGHAAYEGELAVNADRLALLEAGLRGASGAVKVVKYSLAGEGHAPIDIAAADLDGDGDPDLATANQNSNSVSLLMNRGGRLLATGGSLLVGHVPLKLGAGDLDGDGDVDLAAIGQAGNALSLLLNRGKGVFDQATPLRLDTQPWGLEVVDLDGDGKDEAVVAIALNYVQVLRHQDGESFALSEKAEVAGNVNNLVAGDFDGDGRPDIAVGCIVIPERIGKFSILLNRGDGSLGPASHFEAGCFPVSSTAADLDGDGDVDLATVDFDSGALAVFLNHGHASFTRRWTLTLEPRIFTVTAADIDADGDADLALCRDTTGAAWVFLNDGKARFPRVFQYPTEGNSIRLAAADLDGDRRLDLATANGQAGNVSVLFNQEGLFDESATVNSQGEGTGPR